MSQSRAGQTLTLVGYFGLLILLLNWYTWLAPPQTVPVSMLLLVMVAPLLIPMRGLLQGRRYTYGWSGFVALLYFALGVDVAFNDVAERVYGLFQVLFALLFFVGCTLYLRGTRKSPEAAGKSVAGED